MHCYCVICVLYLSSKASSIVCRDLTIHLADAARLYEKFLPSIELLDMEMHRWKLRWQSCPPEYRPSTCAAAIKVIDPLDFSNIALLMQIAYTIPVASCECERSASALRRLHTWSRASMGQDKLSALAMLHIHYTHLVDMREVVDKFAEKHPRRRELDNILLH